MICSGRNVCIGMLLLMGLVLFSGKCLCQTRKELEKEREKAMEEIEFTNKVLERTKRFRKESLNQLIIVKEKINKRNVYIRTLEDEINLLIKKISDNSWIIKSLANDLNKIRVEYEKIIVGSYKKSKNQDHVMFFLSSESYRQAYRRIKYYKQYAKYRKKQAKKIVAIKNILDSKESELENDREKKQELLSNMRSVKEKLNSEKEEKNRMVINLGKKEKKLRNELRKRERIAKQLKKEIERMLEEESKRGKGIIKLTPEEKIIAANFSSNKGKLPWPAERGIIIGKFGKHNHPVLKNVKINNNGIDIATVEKADIRAIFDGEVRKIVAIKGANNTVLIKHGNFYTVYQNLVEVNVKAGEKVKIKQKIGVVYSAKDSENDSIIHFEIWENNIKMDPEKWIAK